MITAQNTLLRIQFGIIASFIIVKFLMRPFVLQNNFPEAIKIFVLSYPNFCEAIIGTIALTYILLMITARATKNKPKFKERYVYLISVLAAGVYVILQEFRIHNLGGINVYDPYDVLFSVLGLITAYFLLIRVNPKIINA